MNVTITDEVVRTTEVVVVPRSHTLVVSDRELQVLHWYLGAGYGAELYDLFDPIAKAARHAGIDRLEPHLVIKNFHGSLEAAGIK